MATEALIRCLVVDDSALMRKMISDILRKDGMEVIGTAYDGVDGLEKARCLKPDVITLDVEMPRMDGLSFLRELMPDNPTPVVVLSSLTETGADTTIRCLESGACDCLHKPSGAISLDIERIAGEIRTKVRAAARANRRRLTVRACAGVTPRALPSTLSVIRATPCSTGGAVILIASSTGGPAALQRVIPRLPGSLPASVVVVQHLPAGFTRPLANRLDGVSALRVREAAAGDRLETGMALVAPAGMHLAFDERSRVMLTGDPPLWGVRPAADVTFCSAAERFGKRVLAVVLTGMGRDGSVGVRTIRQHGGSSLAQDEASCVVFGMPRAAYETGAVERLLPIDEIAPAITRYAQDMDGREPAAKTVGASA